MQDHCFPPSSLVHRSITPPHIFTLVDQGRVSNLTCCVTTTSPLRRPVADLHHGWFGSKERLGPAQIALRFRPMEKMLHAPLVPRSRMAQRFTESGLK